MTILNHNDVDDVDNGYMHRYFKYLLDQERLKRIAPSSFYGSRGKKSFQSSMFYGARGKKSPQEPPNYTDESTDDVILDPVESLSDTPARVNDVSEKDRLYGQQNAEYTSASADKPKSRHARSILTAYQRTPARAYTGYAYDKRGSQSFYGARGKRPTASTAPRSVDVSLDRQTPYHDQPQLLTQEYAPVSDAELYDYLDRDVINPDWLYDIEDDVDEHENVKSMLLNLASILGDREHSSGRCY